MRGLMNQPQGNNLVNMRGSKKHLNITTGLLQFISKLNHSQIKFKDAISKYAMFKRNKNMETSPRGILGDFIGDVMIVTLVVVIAIIIIASLYNLRKYRMNGACWQKNAKKNAKNNVRMNESVTQPGVVLGSKEQQGVSGDVRVTAMKVICCGSCGVTPLCCKACSQQAVIQSAVVQE